MSLASGLEIVLDLGVVKGLGQAADFVAYHDSTTRVCTNVLPRAAVGVLSVVLQRSQLKESFVVSDISVTLSGKRPAGEAEDAQVVTVGMARTRRGEPKDDRVVEVKPVRAGHMDNPSAIASDLVVDLAPEGGSLLYHVGDAVGCDGHLCLLWWLALVAVLRVSGLWMRK
jgi:hypothetical protein